MRKFDHPRKGETAPGQAARGSGALCASVDVLMEMKLPSATQPQDRRRKLLAWSRYDGTPREQVIELSPDGADLVRRGSPDPAGSFDRRSPERGQLAPPKRVGGAGDLRSNDRCGVRRPAHNSVILWRTLDSAVEHGALEQEGTGRKRDPFRYFLPGLDAEWDPDYFELLGMD